MTDLRQPRAPVDARRSAFVSGAALLTAAASALGASPAWASNADSFLYGDRASLMGGAVLASASDTSALWYNPAGLGVNSRNKLELSASAFMYRLRHIPAFLRVSTTGYATDQEIESSEIFVVPSALAWVFQLSDGLSLGLGIFVTQQDVFRFDGQRGNLPEQAGMDLDMQGRLSGQLFTYHLGGAIGWQMTPAVRIGGGLFAVYETHDEFRKLFARSTTEGTYSDTFLQRLVDAEVSRISLEGTLGLQWAVADDWTLGALLRFPRITVSESAATDNSTAIISHGEGVPTLAIANVDNEPLNVKGTGLTTPPRYFLGAAWQALETLEVSAEADLRPPLLDRHDATKWVYNVRVGSLWSVNESNTLGLGLFTDRYGGGTPRVFPDYSADYYGVTFGWKRLTEVKLEEKEDAASIVFSTTGALRYAAGFGESTTIRFDYSDTANTGLVGRVDDERVDVVFHEISVYIGTAVEF